MDTYMEKALDFIREQTDEYELYHMRLNCAMHRAPFSYLYPREADATADLLEEYGQDNDLPEGWWCEYGDINEIIGRI